MDRFFNKQQSFKSSDRIVFRYKALPFILFVGVVFFVTSFLFPVEYNPDYVAYKWIYENDAINYAQASVDLLFVEFVRAVRFFQVEYEAFRGVFLLCSLVILFYSFILFDKWLQHYSQNSDSIRLKFTPMLLLVVTAAVFVFFLEFHLVRIRAGLAISVMALSFSVYLTTVKNNIIIKRVIVFLLLVAGYNLHSSTFIVLGYMLFIPFIYSYLFNKTRCFLSRNLSIFIIIFIAASASLMIVYAVNVKSVARGPNLFSHLHIARLLGIAVIPLLLPLLLKFLRECLPKETNVINLSRNGNFYNGDILTARAQTWLIFSTLTYLSLALSLALLYSMGMIETSGEAMVRFFTLSSVPAIFAILIGRSKYSFIWQYMLLINSLFFAKSILTPLFAS